MSQNNLNIIILKGYDPTHAVYQINGDYSLVGTAMSNKVKLLNTPKKSEWSTILFKLHGGFRENNNQKILNASCLYDIPKSWIKIINDKKCQIVIDTTVESWSPSYGDPIIRGEEEVNLHEIATYVSLELGIDPNQITWVTSDLNAERYFKDYKGINVKSHCMFYFLSQSTLQSTIIKDMVTDVFDQMSLCMMRDTAKTHRMYSIYKIFEEDIQTHIIRTTSAKCLYGRTVCDNYVSLYEHCYDNKIQVPFDWKNMRSHILEYYSGCPHEIENDDVDEALRRTLISLVSESYATGKKLFITYSTFRAILARRPFLFIANKGILQQLKTWGFKTYSDIFDESYDEIEDVYERTDHIFETIKKISESDWDDIYRKSAEVAQYNYEHFLKTTDDSQNNYIAIFEKR